MQGQATPVKVSRSGPVLRLTLSRPEKRNAFNESMVAALEFEAAKASRDPSTRVVLLEGEGPAFCAGADLGWMRMLGERTEDENRKSAQRMASMFHTLDRLTKPLVGRVHGACLGGGMGLAAVCDIAIAGDDCLFATSEVRFGILPAVIAPYLVRKIGMSRCRDLMLTGRRLDPDEALQAGLVHHLVPDEELDRKVEEVVESLVKGAPGAQQHVKEFLFELEKRDRRGEPLGPWTADEIARARASDEGREGLRAFLEKTKAPWVV